MPVVDEAGVMLGIITVDDAWDALEDDRPAEGARRSWLRYGGIALIAVLVLALYTLVLVQVLT